MSSIPGLTPTDHLQVNTNNSRRYFVSGLSEAQGVTQLRNLLSTTETEESWIYLPKKRMWIETGREETQTEITHDVDIAYAAFQNGEEVIFYHIHPYAEEVEIVAQAGVDQLLAQSTNPNISREEWVHKRRLNLLSRLARPSATDLQTVVTHFFKNKTQNLNPSFQYKIVSPCGVTEYRLTSKGVETFKKEKNENGYLSLLALIEHLYSSSVFSQRAAREASGLEAEILDPLEQIPTELSAIAGDNYQIAFKSFDDLRRNRSIPLVFVSSLFSGESRSFLYFDGLHKRK